MRIDKLLANLGYGSRKEVHQLIKKERILCNGEILKKKDADVDVEVDKIALDGELIDTKLVHYIMLHKPAGYVTATEDARERTVMELLPPCYQKMKVYPVGRLDKDTEGLLLFSNDGKWSHEVIHGKRDVKKIYYLQYEGRLSTQGVQAIQSGITLENGEICKPAIFSPIKEGEAYLTICEGKYHQVKRMIAACGARVTYLKRVAIGNLTLDGLEIGTYKDIDKEAIWEN